MAEVGRRLRATVRGEDVVARMGGGAFAVLAEGTTPTSTGWPPAACRSSSSRRDRRRALELTAGVGVVPLEDGLDVDALLARADLAVRAAHEAGIGSARRYTHALGDAAARQDRLRHDLQGARARDELFLLFQPIVSLEEQRITGLEAQLRWRHPELGEIPPAEFLPLAERTGLIGELLRWALEEAARAAAGLPEGEHRAARRPQDPVRLPRDRARWSPTSSTRCAARVSPRSGWCCRSTRPTAMSDDERTGLDVASLRLMGVHVALDGFGGGSSALAHLTRLPIDIVRLDRSLITRIDRDPQSRALCESIVGIAGRSTSTSSPTGVETPAQLAALSGFGCGFAQGFLFSRPRAAGPADRDARRRRRRSAARAWSGRGDPSRRVPATGDGDPRLPGRVALVAGCCRCCVPAWTGRSGPGRAGARDARRRRHGAPAQPPARPGRDHDLAGIRRIALLLGLGHLIRALGGVGVNPAAPGCPTSRWRRPARSPRSSASGWSAPRAAASAPRSCSTPRSRSPLSGCCWRCWSR